MACILFLATPDTADRGCRNWSWHRKGDELAKTRREQRGLPAPDLGPNEVVAAVEVSDFAFIEHRAELETVEHRTLSDWLLIKHYVPLEDAMFANIRRVYQFGRNFTLPHALVTLGHRLRNKRGAFEAFYEDDLLAEALTDNGHLDGACCEFQSAWASWREVGVRRNFKRFDNPFASRVHEPGSRSESHKRSCVLCMHLHPELLQLIKHGLWATLAHKTLGGPKRMGHAFFLHLGSPTSKTADLPASMRTMQPSFSLVTFKPQMFRAAASIIRGHNVHGDEPETLGVANQSNVLAWLDAMVEHCGGSPEAVARIAQKGVHRVSLYAIERLIVAVRIANYLRNDGRAADVLKLAGSYMGLPEEWQADSIKVPSASTVRRYRFRLEAVYTYLIRARLRAWIDAGVEFIVVLLFDSSPRAGREWMLGEIFIMRLDRLAEFQDAMFDLAAVRERSVVDPESWNEAHAARLNAVMHQAVWHIILTPACLGARATKLANKFKAAIHTLRLLADCWDMLRHLLACLVCMCSDLGVESDLPRVEFDCAKLFPHWSHKVQDESAFGDMHLRGDSAVLGFTHGLAAPGAEHICHNMQQQVITGMTHFPSWFALATHLGRFLRGRYYVDRLVNTCVPKTSEANWFRDRLYGFNEQPHEKRFGSLISYMLALRPLKPSLQRWYDDAKFNSAEKEGNDDEEQWCDVNFVTTAIKSHAFWGRGMSLVALNMGVEEVRNFTRGCHCHRKMFEPEGELHSYFRARMRYFTESQRKQPCPGKGLCAPEFALGEALVIFKNGLAQGRGMLLAELERVSADERQEILLDYDRAVSRLVVLAELKFGMWETLPLGVCGLAGRNIAAVRRLMARLREDYRKTADSPHHYIVLALFKAGSEVALQMDLFIDECASFDSLGKLLQWRLRLRHVRVNELSVERLHRSASLWSMHANRHSPDLFVALNALS